MKKFQFQISWLTFITLFAAYITAMNFVLFDYMFSNLNAEQGFLKLVLVGIYFCLWMMILSLIVFAYVGKFLLIIFIFSTAFSSYFMSSYGVIIDFEMIRNAIRTDSKEVIGLLNLKFILYILFLGFVPALFVWRAKIVYGALKRHIITRFASFFIATALLALLFLPLSKTLVPFFRTYNLARVYNTPLYQIYSVIKLIKLDYLPKQEFKQIATDASLDLNVSKKKFFILIVGETARAANYSLGDYTKNETNPITPHEGVIFFDNFYSCGTSTAKSLPCMFSSSKRANHSNSEHQENVLDVLQRVGVKVTWLDNNSGGCQGVCDRLKNKQQFSNEFDGFFIDEIKNRLENLEPLEMIVVHLQGSHGPTYYKRYPYEWRKFTPTCDTNDLAKCSQEELINTYDNTILYTDHVVEEIIDYAKLKKDYEGVVIYVSDHGESLGENGIYLHGMPYLIAPEFQKHVPLLFWSNDKAFNEHAFKNKSLSLSHDNLFSSLLGFFNVKTKEYEPNYDLFSPKLQANE